MPTRPAIFVDHLIKRYKNAPENAIDDISFSLHPGEFFSLLGPNGAGKTTTISILTTLLTKTSGTVRVAGFDVNTHSSQVRQHIGIIFQKPSLDQNLTAEENIRFHALLYGLYPFRPTFSSMPSGYHTQVAGLAAVVGLSPADLQKPVRALSGGMKRKLEIIRSLMHNPQVLFLDEPTSGLDPASRKNLWKYLNSIRRQNGTTIFLTTHYLEEAENSDTVCIINSGRIVAFGPPARIKKDFTRTKKITLEQAYLKIIQED